MPGVMSPMGRAGVTSGPIAKGASSTLDTDSSGRDSVSEKPLCEMLSLGSDFAKFKLILTCFCKASMAELVGAEVSLWVFYTGKSGVVYCL